MKRVLMTGGTGFVGANLARRLLRDGHEVHLLVRPGYSSWRVDEIADSVRFHEVRMTDARGVASHVRRVRPEWVFHLAAYGGSSWHTELRQMIAVNVTATSNLVNACMATGFEAFVHAGSSSEYGFKDHAPVETEWLDPNSHYAVTKAFASQFCRYVATAHKAPICTLRLYSVYGPYEDPRRLISALIVRGISGGWPPLVDPDIARDFVFVDDVADAFVRAASLGNRMCGAVYNIGSGKQMRIRDAVRTVRRILNVNARPQWNSMPNRVWDASIWVCDHARAQRDLGWKAQHSFAEGVRKTAAWFRECPSRILFYEQQGVRASPTR